VVSSGETTKGARHVHDPGDRQRNGREPDPPRGHRSDCKGRRRRGGRDRRAGPELPCPPLVSDEDEARQRAKLRLERCLASLTAVGIEARGWIGDADPLQAIADALHFVSAGQIVIATHPEGRANWLARRLVPRARRRFAIPILHVVVDEASGEGYLLAA
jgi:hypothetical protein